MILSFAAYFGVRGIDLEVTISEAPDEVPRLFVLALVDDTMHHRGRVRDIARDDGGRIMASIQLPEEAVALIRDTLAQQHEWKHGVRPISWQWDTPCLLRGKVLFDGSDEQIIGALRGASLIGHD